MNKALPYVVAAVLGLGVAGLMWMGMSDASAPVTPEAASRPSASGGPLRTSVGGADDASAVPTARPPGAAGGSRSGASTLGQRSGEPPPPGTLRPLNKAELAYTARQERPYNQHYDHVSSYWRRTVQILASKDPALASEAGAMETFLRGGTRVDSPELDVNAALESEKALVQKIRRTVEVDDELDAVLNYIDQSAGVALQGGDVSQVPRPTAQ